MKKLYTAFSVFLLVLSLTVGLWAAFTGGLPKIGVLKLKDGEYASSFHNSLAKEFPGRETLLQWNRDVNQFYAFSGFSSGNGQLLVPIVNDGADHGASLPDLQLPTLSDMKVEEDATFENDQTESNVQGNTEDPSEREQMMNGTLPEYEEPTQDVPSHTESTSEAETIPEKEPSVEALGQILLVDDRAIELPVANYSAIDTYSQSVNSIGAALDGINVYSLLVPNAAGLYAPEDYQQGNDHQKTMISYAYSNMDPAICKVDAFSVLEDHKEEYLYFRTDHHWTHLGAYYAYSAFCEEAGILPVPLKNFETGKYDTFLGTMYSFLSGYPQREILRDNPDQLTYYIPNRETKVRYYDSGNLSYGGSIPILYDLSDSYSNKYICFLGGDHPVTVIESDCPRQRVCLLIKESYGNAFSTWLTGHYSKIICIDPREFNRNGKPSLDLASFAIENGVDDCIILNYPLMINSSAYAAWLGRLAS